MWPGHMVFWGFGERWLLDDLVTCVPFRENLNVLAHLHRLGIIYQDLKLLNGNLHNRSLQRY